VARAGLLGVLMVVVAAGCGGAAERHGPRCPAKVATALGPGARAKVAAVEVGQLTCVFATANARVRVSLDDNPQAWYRFKRAEVERFQATTADAHARAQQPVIVEGVGAGAFWVRATRELVASDGRRLLTVQVARPAALAAARRTAVRIAPAGLGPKRVPRATGP
jgi:hypothetical protein